MRSLFLILVGSVLSFYSSGCMMIGMHGMGGMHDSHEIDEQKSEFIVKEIYKEGLIITTKFPSVVRDNNAIFSVTVLKESTNQPAEDAEVYIEINKLDETVTDHHQHQDKSENEQARIRFEQIKKGYFELTKIFSTEGTYQIKVAIIPGENMGLEKSVEIIGSFDVVSPHHSADKDSSINPLYIIGGIGMAVVMVFMMSTF